MAERLHPKSWSYTRIAPGVAYVAATRSGFVAGHVVRRGSSWDAYTGAVCLGREFRTRHSAAHCVWETVIVPQGLDYWKVK